MSWWTAGGATGAVGVWQPIGAASLAASYADLSGTGNDAAPGTAPTFDTAIGWSFNGTTQWLATPVAGDLKPTTIVARVTFASAGSIRFLWAGAGSGGLSFNRSQSFGSPAGCMVLDKVGVAGIGNSTTVAPVDGTSMVVGATYTAGGVWTHYLNGAADGTGTNSQTLTGGLTTEIGGWSPAGTAYLHHGTMAALAAYDNALTAPQMAAVMAAMAALPVTSTPVASIIQAHGLYLGASLGGA